MTDERAGWLTDIERQVIERPTLSLGAKTLYRLEQLSTILYGDGGGQLAESVRKADEKTLRAIRRSASKLLDALDILPREDVASTEVLDKEIRDTGDADRFGVEDEVVFEAIHGENFIGQDQEVLPELRSSEDEDQNETNDENEALHPNALKFLRRVFEVDDSLELTQKDISHLTHFLMHARGAMGPRTKLDYRQLIAGNLQGLSHSEIAKIIGSTPQSTTVAAMNFMKAVLENQGGIKKLERREEWGFRVGTTAPIKGASQAPVPHPPKVRLAVNTDVVTARKDNEAQEDVLSLNLDIITQAVESPNLISPNEWAEAARSAVLTLAQRHGFTADESMSLWDRVHFDDANRYAQPVNQQIQKVMGEMAKVFIQRSKERITDPGLARENVGIRVLVVANGDGLGNLDVAYEKMGRIKNNKYQHELTRHLAQRHVVNGVVALLR